MYKQVCTQCHLKGEGVPTLYPPLTGSPILRAKPEAAIRNILQGSQGQSRVNGKPVTGVMIPLNSLSDEEIAAVVTYVRWKFADRDGPLVLPAQVAEQR